MKNLCPLLSRWLFLLALHPCSDYIRTCAHHHPQPAPPLPHLGAPISGAGSQVHSDLRPGPFPCLLSISVWGSGHPSVLSTTLMSSSRFPSPSEPLFLISLLFLVKVAITYSTPLPLLLSTSYRAPSPTGGHLPGRFLYPQPSCQLHRHCLRSSLLSSGWFYLLPSYWSPSPNLSRLRFSSSPSGY